jgi:hypothetical protein
MRLVETIPRIGGGDIKENDIVRTLVNVTMYPSTTIMS